MGSPTFQARFGEDRYPTGRFIRERSRALGISPSDLVRRLGYRDISSGQEALSEVLLPGMVAPHIAKYLANALKIEDALVESVVGATTCQKTLKHACDGSRAHGPTSRLSDNCRVKQSASFNQRKGSSIPFQALPKVLFYNEEIRREFFHACKSKYVEALVHDFFLLSILASIFREKTVRQGVSDIIDASDCTSYRRGYFFYSVRNCHFFIKKVSSSM
jgi:hypothetical protein